MEHLEAELSSFNVCADGFRDGLGLAKGVKNSGVLVGDSVGAGIVKI